MGLTIHYSFHSKSRSRRKAIDTVTQLRNRALDLPFDTVGKVVEVSDADRVGCRDMGDPKRTLMSSACAYIYRNDRVYSVDAKEVIGFTTQPGDGCEPAYFGFCRYPSRIEAIDSQTDAVRNVTTGLTGWQWGTFCKTQYAADLESGGVRNFLRCHLSVIGVLDRAQELGVLSSIGDESDFWYERDLEALAELVGEWNVNCADIAKEFKDLLRPVNADDDSPLNAVVA